MEWQPIETAPKDGTEILVTGLNYGEQGEGRHYAIAHWVENIGWTTNNYFEEGMPYLTHWAAIVGPLD